MTATCTIVTQEVKDALSIPVKALKFSPAEGTPMADPKDFPRPPMFGDSTKFKDFAKKAENGDFPPPPPGMGAGGPPPGGPGGFGPPGKGGFGQKKGQRPKLSGNHVWVSIDGKAAPRPVKIGISDGVNVQILKGLSEGDSVVVSQETLTATTKKSDAASPFMPTPPGKKKRK